MMMMMMGGVKQRDNAYSDSKGNEKDTESESDDGRIRNVEFLSNVW